jgi:hypothetical protein
MHGHVNVKKDEEEEEEEEEEEATYLKNTICKEMLSRRIQICHPLSAATRNHGTTRQTMYV